MSPVSTTAPYALRLLTAALFASITFVAATTFAARPAIADDLIVRYDQSQLLRMPRAIDQVIVGNPSIADVSVQRGNILVVTGKTFGVTNIIALDPQQNVIQDQRVIVQRDERRIVNVHKGSQRESFSCSPNCSPTITIGDGNAFFDTISKHAQAKTQFSNSSSDGGGAQ